MTLFAVKVSWSLYCFISYIYLVIYLMVSKTVFPGFGVQGFLMLFLVLFLLDLEAGSKIMISSKLLLHLGSSGTNNKGDIRAS